MTFRLSLAMATAMLLFPMAALAADNPASATPQASQDDGEPKLVCKRERKTGSNVTTRVCRTQEQMTLERDEARKLLERSQGAGALNPAD